MRTVFGSMELSEWLEAPTFPVTVVGCDLTRHDGAFLAADLSQSVFVGCVLDSELRGKAAREAAVLPALPIELPVPQFRSSTYRTAKDLYSGFDPEVPDSWKQTPDHAAFSWFVSSETGMPRPLDVVEMLAARTHDTCVEKAAISFIQSVGLPVVAVMGGHDVSRERPVYGEVALIARDLARGGRLIVTGGGPGLMEAANLGAFLAPYADEALDEALTTLGPASDFKSHDWLKTACDVRASHLGTWDGDEQTGSISLGIPTWLYGHEPPNLFATHSAKLFFNSLREDGLVTVADGGIIFAEGNAGTVQEIFQDVTQNYYRDKARVTPMVLLATEYWTRDANDLPQVDPVTGKVKDRRKPLWPLLRQLATEKAFVDDVLLSSDRDQIVAHLPQVTTEHAAGPSLAYKVQGASTHD